MRYPLNIDSELWHLFKVECVKVGSTMRDVIVGLIRAWIVQQREKEEGK